MSSPKFMKFAGLLVGVLFVFILGSPQTSEAIMMDDRVSDSQAITHYAMGQMYDLNGEPQKAVGEYEAALKFDQESYWIHLRLGADYARLDMLPKAISELKTVQTLNQSDLQSHYLLALIFSAQKDYAKAADEYEIILKSLALAEPDNMEIRTYLGQLYYSEKKYEPAIEQFEIILKQDSKNADLMYLLGSLYIEINQKKKAIDLLAKSIEVDPQHDGSLNTLGYLYAEEETKLDDALKLINRALQISPNNGAYLDSLGWVYYKEGQYDKAIETFKKADAVLNDPVIYDHMGDAYYKLNQLDEAIRCWQLSLDLLPDQKNILHKLNNAKNISTSKKF